MVDAVALAIAGADGEAEDGEPVDGRGGVAAAEGGASIGASAMAVSSGCGPTQEAGKQPSWS